MVKELEHLETLFNLLQEWEIKYFIYFTQNKNKNDKRRSDNILHKNEVNLTSISITVGLQYISPNLFICFLSYVTACLINQSSTKRRKVLQTDCKCFRYSTEEFNMAWTLSKSSSCKAPSPKWKYGHLQKDRMKIITHIICVFIVIYIVFGRIITFDKYSILL